MFFRDHPLDPTTTTLVDHYLYPILYNRTWNSGAERKLAGLTLGHRPSRRTGARPSIKLTPSLLLTSVLTLGYEVIAKKTRDQYSRWIDRRWSSKPFRRVRPPVTPCDISEIRVLISFQIRRECFKGWRESFSY